MDSQFDPAALRRSMDGLRLARISNEIEGAAEHPEDRALVEAAARGEMDGVTFLERLRKNVARRYPGERPDGE